MTDILLSNENMQYINMAAKITKTDILDCVIQDDKLIFIVQQGQLGAAIGIKAYKIKKIELEGEDDSIVAKVDVEVSDKSKIIGKGGRNIETIRQLAQRHHSFKDVQIK